MQDKNIFITGATGFIGKKLINALQGRNHIFVLLRPGPSEKYKRLNELNINIISGNLLDAKSYSDVLKNIDYVFHLAALFKLDASREELYKCNVLGTKTLLESCVDKNIKKIVYFSTAYVAGAKEKNFITEDEPYPGRFKNLYEWSKAEAEKVAVQFCKEYKLPIVILRPVIVYGEGSHYGFYDALSLISKNKMWALPGNGKNKVHFVHVDDVVNAAIHLAQLEDNSGEFYNISDSGNFSCSEIVNFMCHQLGVRPPFTSLPKFLVKFCSRISIWKLFFKNVPPQLLDYFLCNQTYSNSKILLTGFKFNYPYTLDGLKSTIKLYLENGLLTKAAQKSA